MIRKLLQSAVAVLICGQLCWAQSTKARTFNGSSDNLQSASTIDLTSTDSISLAFWLYADSFSGTSSILETSAAYSSNVGALWVLINSSEVQFRNFVAGASNECHITPPSAAAWHHYVITWNSSTNPQVCKAYVDGAADSAVSDSVANSGGTYGNYTLNVMSRNAASLFTAGRISDIAIWKSILTAGNAATLAACGDPDSLTPDFYWEIKQVSPETPNAGGVKLTVTGTSNSASNCTTAPAVSRKFSLLGVGK